MSAIPEFIIKIIGKEVERQLEARVAALKVLENPETSKYVLERLEDGSLALIPKANDD